MAYEELYSTLTNNNLVKGIKKASPFAQTSYLEGFHSVLNHFTPKMIAYFYVGMYCRCLYFKLFELHVVYCVLQCGGSTSHYITDYPNMYVSSAHTVKLGVRNQNTSSAMTILE